MIYSKEFLEKIGKASRERGLDFFRAFGPKYAEKVKDHPLMICECRFCHGKGKDVNTFHMRETSYYCFCCGSTGDEIACLMVTRLCSFSEAVEILARWLNIPLEEAEKGEKPVITESKLEQLARAREMIESQKGWLEKANTMAKENE